MHITEFLVEHYRTTVSLVSAVAWPVAFAAVSWMFRKEFRVVLMRLKSLNFRSGELLLNEKLEAAKETAEEASLYDGSQQEQASEPTERENSRHPTSSTEDGPERHQIWSKLKSYNDYLANVEPRKRSETVGQLVAQPWFRLEKELVHIAETFNVDAKELDSSSLLANPPEFHGFIKKLLSSGTLPASEVRLIVSIYDLARDMLLVIPLDTITAEQLNDYQNLVKRAMVRLARYRSRHEQAENKNSNPDQA